MNRRVYMLASWRCMLAKIERCPQRIRRSRSRITSIFRKYSCISRNCFSLGHLRGRRKSLRKNDLGVDCENKGWAVFLEIINH